MSSHRNLLGRYPVAAWVELKRPVPPDPPPEEVDEEFVRRLEARRATPAA